MKASYLIVLVVTSLTLSFCKDQKKPSQISSSVVDSLEGSCPYLTKDGSDNLVLSWIRSLKDSTFVFCYVKSIDGGNSFGKPVVVAPSTNIHPHSENIPKVIFKPSGEILAIWGAANPDTRNAYAGVIYFSQSFDNGKTWSEAKKLVADSAGFDQRYFDVSLKPDGEVAIIWLDNRKKINKEGSALYFATTQGSNGFQHEKAIAESCCECCRTVLTIDKHNNIHVLYRAILNDSIRDMVHSISSDDGKTFTEPKKISDDNWVIRGCPHSGPSMTASETGMHVAWFTGGNPRGLYYAYSTDEQNFGLKESVSIHGKHPQITELPNGNLCTTWDEQTKSGELIYNRIGIQLRSSTGKGIFKTFITPDTSSCSYPVIKAIDNHSALIAFNQRLNKKNYVYYRVVAFYKEYLLF